MMAAAILRADGSVSIREINAFERVAHLDLRDDRLRRGPASAVLYPAVELYLRGEIEHPDCPQGVLFYTMRLVRLRRMQEATATVVAAVDLWFNGARS